MFELLLSLTAAVLILGMAFAYDGSRDILHPLFFASPMLGLLYVWMPWKLLASGGLASFFDRQQLVHVQTLYFLGVLAFVVGCLLAGTRSRPIAFPPITHRTQSRMLAASAVLGLIGLACWGITIINVGGFTAAFSTSYSGGWDDSGYVRDGAMLLLIGVLLSVMALAKGAPRIPSLVLMALFGLPWLSSALLMGRRGPTFCIVAVVLLSWYLPRGTRPPVVFSAIFGAALAFLVLFLVTNRQSIYLGSDREMKSDVTDIVDKAQTGNEFIYGSGTVLSAERRDHYFWMRRYLAQVLVRPIPSSVWPTKYEDFGVPELLYNAGTGEGFADTLGWNGAVGSAPAIIADLWLEVWWFAVPFMGVLGWVYGVAWRRAVVRGGPHLGIYIVLATLSIYLIMQTMEATIFRSLELGIPCWLAMRWAAREPAARKGRRGVRPRFAHLPLRKNEVQHA